jgi:uncharacterized phage protein (predicted DNA packaging)
MEIVRITDLDVAFVKEYLRVDHEEDDLLIRTFIESSKSYIQNYLGLRFEEFEVIPEEFSVAALAVIAHWYERRGIQATKDDRGEMNHIFSALLDAHRNHSHASG